MLRATGRDDAAIAKPFVAVVHSWSDVSPCNFTLRAAAQHVRRGIEANGGTAIEFNTVAVTDGIAMGTAGMRASLVSRDWIADSIELAVNGHSLDAMVILCGCDKTIPAMAMALGRIDIPGLLLYGGSIAHGVHHGKHITIQEVFEAVGAHSAGKIGDAELLQVEKDACPGAGACGGQFTANTMAMVLTTLGLSPLGANDLPAIHVDRARAGEDCGKLVMDCYRRGFFFYSLKCFDILERLAPVACMGYTDALLIAALNAPFTGGPDASLAAAQGAAWPTRPIRLISPYGAGGASDISARILAEGLGKQLDPDIDMLGIAAPYLMKAMVSSPPVRPPYRSPPPALPAAS